ncbi:hypothetical protein XENORESO_014494 [Xenotaenia resolanae]|uniref:Uncharacterized protein n=1 Tax=Xenotaenia resolanae TaxID=208358 RepID=A0ABV0VS87_9TELE
MFDISTCSNLTAHKLDMDSWSSLQQKENADGSISSGLCYRCACMSSCYIYICPHILNKISARCLFLISFSSYLQQTLLFPMLSPPGSPLSASLGTILLMFLLIVCDVYFVLVCNGALRYCCQSVVFGVCSSAAL